MKDLKIISARAILPIRQVVPVRGFSPVSVLVTGQDLDRVSELFYNNAQADQFVVQSPERLLLRVPDSQVGRPLTSVVAYAAVPTTASDASVNFCLTSPARPVQGIERLVQSFLMIFMSSPGSDIFDQYSGGGAFSLVGKGTGSDGSSLSASIALAVERTKSEIVASQAKYPGLPLSERLLSAYLESVSFDKESSTLYARVSLQNMLGNSAEVSIG